MNFKTFPLPLDQAIDKQQEIFIYGDNLEVLKSIPDKSHNVIYIDPPFNTGKKQVMARKSMKRSSDENKSDSQGFAGNHYDHKTLSTMSYEDTFTDLVEFLRPRLEEAYRILTDDGTLYCHLDWREVHYVKIYLDTLFGRDHFLNEIIWAYDYGAKPKNRWPAKHDTILVYVKNKNKYHFDNERVEREPYMAPGLVSEEKRKKGKMPTSVMWHTIVPTNGKERTGYPTQKPEGLLKRFIVASCPDDGRVLDFFAGSGTVGAVCKNLNLPFTIVDQNPEAIEVWKKRFNLPADALEKP